MDSRRGMSNRAMKMILMGDSIDAYLASLYAQRHPEDIKHLILVNPAGASDRPHYYEMAAIFQPKLTSQGQL